jgi:hypothetical protein
MGKHSLKRMERSSIRAFQRSHRAWNNGDIDAVQRWDAIYLALHDRYLKARGFTY